MSEKRGAGNPSMAILRNGTEVLFYLEKLEPLLSKVDQSRTRKLMALFERSENGEVNLRKILETLYPGKDETSALNAFRQYRYNLSEAAKEHDIAFSLQTDKRKRVPPSERICYAEGNPFAFERELAFSTTAQVRIDESVPPKGKEITDENLKTFFISYAHDDREAVLDLLQRLEKHLKASKHYRYKLWYDGEIEVGEEWSEAIEKAMQESHFGLFCVTPSFLNSGFIKETELPHFLEMDKPVIPVAVDFIDFERHNLLGLETKQFFKPKEAYALLSKKKKERYAYDLFVAIENRMKKLEENQKTMTNEQLRKSLIQSLQERDKETQKTIEPKGVESTLKSSGWEDSVSTRIDLLPRLLHWYEEETSIPYCALLGDYGMGKTVTAKLLALEIAKKPTFLPPIYVDLRALAPLTEVPSLETIFNKLLSYSPQYRDMDAKRLIRLVRDEGALIIWDGLDEVGTYLSEAQNVAFIRTLFSVLGEEEIEKAKGKMLLTCRTHFFRNIVQQRSMLIQNNRTSIRADHFRVFEMVPWRDEEIRAYLRKHLPENFEIERAVALLRNIHNLGELAQRPFNLRILSEIIPKLERKRASQERLYAVDLYEQLVEEWLNRDSGKHRIDPLHKKELMYHLAHTLWREQSRSWHIDDMERWFEAYIKKREWQSEEKIALEYLKEDLRTATFIVREGEERFRFAHTSLQEYFLAKAIYTDLEAGEKEVLHLPAPSIETFDFFAELLDKRERRATLEETLEAIFSNYNGLRSDNAWSLLLRLNDTYIQKGLLKTNDIDLGAINLSDQTIRPKCSRLSLSGLRLRGAKLRRSRWYGIDMPKAHFEDVAMQQCFIYDSTLNAAQFTNCALQSGALIRCKLFNCDLSASDCRNLRIIEAQALGSAKLPQNQADSRIAPVTEAMKTQNNLIFWQDNLVPSLIGHEGSVNALAYSPDGRHIVSGGDDDTLRIWDATSGEALMRLEGHESLVNALAYSPDGRHIVSGSLDSTLRIWDATSGEALMTLRGHESSVNALAYSPDGRHIVSGSRDHTLRIWDATSGKLRYSYFLFNEENYATFDVEKNAFIAMSDDSIDYIGWNGRIDGRWVTLPPQAHCLRYDSRQ